MRILFDINVVLDVLARTEDFRDSFEAIDIALFKGYDICMTSCMPAATVIALESHYDMPREEVLRRMGKMLLLFKLLDVTREDVDKALRGAFVDPENAVIAQVAERCNVDVIVTRDRKGFRYTSAVTMTPGDFVRLYRPADFKEIDVLETGE